MKNVKQFLQHAYSGFKKEGTFASNIKYYTLYFFVTFLIQLIFTPIVARVFTASAYGTFTLVSSLATYASLFFTLQLEHAIVVQKTDDEARQVSRAIFTINCIAVLASYLIVGGITCYYYLRSAEQIGDVVYLLWIPVLSFAIAAHTIYGNVANRNKTYKRIYQVMSPLYLVSKVSTIGWGQFVSSNFFGLYLGEIIFRTFAVLLGFKYVVRQNLLHFLKFISLRNAFEVARKNSNYIFFELPLRVISLLNSQLPVYFLAIYYDRNTVGHFAFANAFLEIPVRLISYSFGIVFFQKASEVVSGGGNMFAKSVKMLGGLFLLGIGPFFLLYLFSEEIFSFLFGEQWDYASELAVSLVLFYFSRFVFEPFQVLFRVLGKQKLQFIMTLIYFVIFGIYLFFSMKSKGELTDVFFVMSLLSLSFFIIQTVFIFHLLRLKPSIN